jgi:hypothetical protein
MAAPAQRHYECIHSATAVSITDLPFSLLPHEQPLFEAADASILQIQTAGQDWRCTTLNLLCQHWQARRRVLLTANDDQLLQTISAELSPACEMLTTAAGSDASSWLANEREWKALRQLQIQTEDALVAQIQAESQVVKLAAVQGPPLAIGQYVEQHQARDGWLSDAWSPNVKLPQPKELEQIRACWALANSAAGKPSEDPQLIEQLSGLPDLAQMRSRSEMWQQAAQQATPKVSESQAHLVQALTAAGKNIDQVATVVPLIKQAAIALQKLPAKLDGWIVAAVEEIKHGQTIWNSRKEHLDRVAPLLSAMLSELADRKIEIRTQETGKELRAKLLTIIQHLQAGGSLSWLRAIVQWKVAAWRAWLTKVRLDNRPVHTLAELQLVLKWLELRQTLELCWQAWDGIAKPKSDSLADQLAKVQNLQKTLSSLFSTLHPWSEAERQVVGLQVKGVQLPRGNDAAELQNFAAGLEAYVAHARRKRVPRPFEKEIANLRSWAAKFSGSRLVPQIIAALDGCQLADYERCLQQVKREGERKSIRQRAEKLTAQLAQQLPGLAHQLQATAGDAIWKTRLPAIAAAWGWSQAYLWVREFAQQRQTNLLHRRHAEISQALAQVTLQRTALQARTSEVGQLDAPGKTSGCRTLIPGCCDIGTTAEVVAGDAGDEQVPWDVVMLLTDGRFRPEELLLFARARQIVLLERSDLSLDLKESQATWQSHLATLSVTPQVITAIDPLALVSIPFLPNEAVSENGVFCQEVGNLLQARGNEVRQTAASSSNWHPTFIVPQLAGSVALELHGSEPVASAKLVRNLREQVRWLVAGWQVRHLYASDFYARGPAAVLSLLSPPTTNSGRQHLKWNQTNPQSEAMNARQASEQALPQDRWRRLKQLGVKLRFDEHEQLIAADLRHTLATWRDVVELTDCHALRKVHFPVHTGDECLNQLSWLHRLTSLNLSYTQVTNRALRSLQQCTALRSLNLEGTRVTDAGLDALLSLADLSELDLRITQVTNKGDCKIKQHLPGCRVQISPQAKQCEQPVS